MSLRNLSASSDYFRGVFDSETIYALSGNDYVLGGGGDDYINGGAGNDRLYGNIGDDTLVGNVGNDYLDGGVGFNSLNGGAGNDTFNGRYGVNSFVGGAGTDTVSYAGLSARSGDLAGKGVRVFVGFEADSDRVSDWGAFGDSYDSIESIVGSMFDDDIWFNVKGNAYGGKGNDRLVLQAGGNAYGGKGIDETSLTNGGRAFGGDGDDDFYEESGNRVTGLYDGGSGHDSLHFINDGFFTLDHVETAGTLTFGIGAVVGAKVIADNGAGTSDSQWIGAGDIYLSIENYEGTLKSDWFDITFLNLGPSSRPQLISGLDGDDYLVLRGGGGYAEVSGGGGNDTLVIMDGGRALSGSGNDKVQIIGGTSFVWNEDGNDIITEGANAGRTDILLGLNSGDQFMFGTNVINGFDIGQDRLGLLSGTLGGSLEAGDFVSSAYNRASAQVKLAYDGVSTTVYIDFDGTGSEGQQLLAVVNGVKVTASDFFYV